VSHTIELDDYEVANLRALLQAIGYGTPDCESCGRPLPYTKERTDALRSPFFAANNGDWVGQVYLKLPSVKHKPNASPEQLAEAARRWRAP
jgi:hypothetical protein